MKKSNCCFLLLFVVLGSLLHSQIRNGEIKKIQPSKPDLIVGAALPDPATRKVEVTIRNREFAVAAIETIFLVRFWDPQNTSHRIDTQISHSSVDSQNGYATVFTVPGEWSQLGIKVDATGLIDEKNEDNNLAFIHFEKPDLTVSVQLYDQETRTFRFTAKNLELSSASIPRPFKISFWNPKNTSQRLDVELTPAQLNNANGHTDYFSIPGNWSFQVGVKIDSTDKIEEKNENNNIAFVELARADLTISAKMTNQAQRKIEYTFKNSEYLSAAVTQAVKVKIWDTLKSTNMAVQEFSAAAASHPQGHSSWFTIPRTWSSHVGLKIDSENVIEEKDEANNFAYINF